MRSQALTTLVLLATAMLPVACGSIRTSDATDTPAAITEAEVGALMDAQLEDWNSGSLEDFVAPYAESTTFVGGSGLTVGRERVLANYRLGYPDPATRGTLSFELQDIRPLRSGYAIVIGRWQIERGEPVSGWFSLVVERAPDGELRILHDHSS